MQKRIDAIVEAVMGNVEQYLDELEKDLQGPPPGLRRIPDGQFADFVDELVRQRGPGLIGDLRYEYKQETLKRYARVSRMDIEDVIPHLDRMYATWLAEQQMRMITGGSQRRQ